MAFTERQNIVTVPGFSYCIKKTKTAQRKEVREEILSLSFLPRDYKICSVLASFSYSKRNIIKSKGNRFRISQGHLLYEVGLVLFAGKEDTFLSLPPL